MAFWQSTIDAGRKFCRRPWPERLGLLQALALLSLLPPALRLFGWQHWQGALGHFTPPASDLAAGQKEEALHVASLVRSAARWAPVAPTCLHQALVLGWLLRRRQIPGELRVGVRKRGAALEAHAWIEVAGVVLNDADNASHGFTALARVGGPSEAAP